VAVLTLAGMGKFTLWGAVLVDVGTALAVVLNGMTVLRWTRYAPDEAPECIAERFAREHG
jgi:cation transport ATPase